MKRKMKKEKMNILHFYCCVLLLEEQKNDYEIKMEGINANKPDKFK